MTTQPEALRLAELIDWPSVKHGSEAAAELRRLHEENERCRQVCAATAAGWREETKELLEALSDVAYGLEKSRIWGGMDWSYHPLHPVKYLPLRDKARAAIAKHGEKA